MLLFASWIVPIAIVGVWLLTAAYFALRRVRRARHGQVLLLRRRERIARVYHRMHDGRVYDPDRNPEIARVLDETPPERD